MNDDVVIKLRADISELQRGLNETQKQISGFGNNITSSMKKIAGAIATGFAVDKIIGFGNQCLDAAATLQEMENKFNVVFKSTGDSVKQWAKEYGDAIGRSQTEIMTAVSNQADLMIGMGMTEEVAGDLSKKYTELAYDLASFNNVNDATALEAVTKAMFGETEMAKQLGVNLSVATMENSEYVKSLGKKWDALSQSEKAEAYYQEMIKQSTNAIGDATRSADSYTNQVKRLESVKTRLYEVIGTQLLPIFTPLVTAYANLISKISDLIASFFGVYNATGSFTQALQSLGIETSGLSAIWDAFCNAFNILWVNVLSPVFSALMEAFYMFGALVMEIMPTVQNAFTIAFDGMSLVAEMFGKLFNDVWESMLKPVFELFMDIVIALSEVFADVMPKIQTLWESVLSRISDIYTQLLKPTFEFIFELVQKLWSTFQNYLPQVQRVFGEAIDVIVAVWEKNLKPAFDNICLFLENVLYPAFDFVFTNCILPTVESVFDTLISLWDGTLKPAFEGITEFISGVFTGNWRKAWEGVSKIFSGIWNGLESIAKTPINAIIGMMNKLISGLNTIKLPDWIPGIGGAGINIPKIPKLWRGTNFAKGGMTLVGEQGPELVNLNRGASVLPAHKTRSVLDGGSLNVNGIGSGPTISIGQLVVREEADVNRIAEQLYRLQQRNRRKGGIMA